MDMRMHSNLMSNKAHLHPSSSCKEWTDLKARIAEGKALNEEKVPSFHCLVFFQDARTDWETWVEL